jgi:hypothetical protein
MNDQIELYQENDQKLFQRIPFMPIVRESLEKELKQDLSHANIQVTISQVPEFPLKVTSPKMVNLIPEFGYTYVIVYTNNEILYRHPHPLNDIMTQTLQEKLKKQYPDIQEWKFRVDIPGMPRKSSMRLAPSVQGSVSVGPYPSGKKPGFSIKRIPEKPAPEISLTTLGIHPTDKERLATVKIVLPSDLLNELHHLRPFSDKIEEGGFLVGKLFRDADSPDTHILKIQVMPSAKYTGASFFHFTFTGDSFAEVKQSLNRERPEERLLGWYHTHLFPATVEMGLSTIDLTLHFGTFTFPWQVAALFNLERHHRVLRFYVREGNSMRLCPHWGVHERY